MYNHGFCLRDCIWCIFDCNPNRRSVRRWQFRKCNCCNFWRNSSLHISLEQRRQYRNGQWTDSWHLYGYPDPGVRNLHPDNQRADCPAICHTGYAGVFHFGLWWCQRERDSKRFRWYSSIYLPVACICRQSDNANSVRSGQRVIYSNCYR